MLYPLGVKLTSPGRCSSCKSATAETATDRHIKFGHERLRGGDDVAKLAATTPRHAFGASCGATPRRASPVLQRLKANVDVGPRPPRWPNELYRSGPGYMLDTGELASPAGRRSRLAGRHRHRRQDGDADRADLQTYTTEPLWDLKITFYRVRAKKPTTLLGGSHQAGLRR